MIALACEGQPLDARDRLVIVPTRAAASELVRSIERTRLSAGGAVVLPVLATSRELTFAIADRLAPGKPVLSAVEREVLLGVACRCAAGSGNEPPFRLRPALLSEMLEFYDTLRRHQKGVAAFERLALTRLEPGAEIDRGAHRLVRQTRFLAAAFAEFERRCAGHGVDEHGLRERLLAETSPRPLRHAVVTVSDRTFDPDGLFDADWDLLTRLRGLERLDVVATDGTLAGAAHERIHTLLPSIEEVRADSIGRPAPALVVEPGGAMAHTARDREDEVAGFARRAKRAIRRGEATADRVALVVRQPLPYVYVTREIFRAGGLPYQMFDALPLAAEPYAAALDLVFAAVASSFARGPAVALMRSPHFRWAAGGDEVVPADVTALDRALSEAGYLGQIETLDALLAAWQQQPARRGQTQAASKAGAMLAAVARELVALRSPAPTDRHLSVLIEFLVRHERIPEPDDPFAPRLRRARGAILSTLAALREAFARFDPEPVAFDEVAALVRRRIGGHTFAPRTGKTGIHLIDADSARFGDFDVVQLAGLVDGEWPERPRRNIFYSTEILRELGWPSAAEQRQAARSRFVDLLRLPSSRLIVSTFSLEGDAIVSPSALLDEIEAAGVETIEEAPPTARIFEHEALGLEPISLETLQPDARAWAVHRLAHGDRRGARFHGFTEAHRAAGYSLTALERYQDCPFKFFSADVLDLEEEPEDESTLSPRARGRLVHEVLQRFFEGWDARGGGPITPARLDAARAVFEEVAAPLLDRLGEADAALERLRLFGSAISVGAMDVVLGLEASRPSQVQERWLEYRLEGEFSLGATGAPVPLRGVADRIDLLPDRRLRVIDYKSGAAPDPKRALQAPIYALCAAERLEARDGRPWTVDEASYVALAGRRASVPVVERGGVDGQATLAAARTRLLQLLDGIQRGEFPPRPHDPTICRFCAFSTVCRKDYVGDS